jgi:hypothetical protein
MVGPRKSIRFKPDPLTVALLDLKPKAQTFNPSLVGLVINESYSGCAILLATDLKLKKETKVNIKVGNLSPLKAEIVWLKTLEENIHKVGIRLLE